MAGLAFASGHSDYIDSGGALTCIKHDDLATEDYGSIRRKVCTLGLEKVATEEGRKQGLSNRNSLPENRGMLLVFDYIGRQCIWMKDMKFSLDIMWVNAANNVIKLEQNIAPSTYPTEYCSSGTLFVIELNAGAAARHGLTVGSHIDL
jgi:uncharacterized membrane protein (UPF0127 family)